MKSNLLGLLLLTGSMSLHAAPVSIDAFSLDGGDYVEQGIGFTGFETTRSQADYDKNSFDVTGLNIGFQLTEGLDSYAASDQELHWDVQHNQRNTDVLGDGNGNEFAATLSRSYAFNRLSLTPAFGINWQDSDLVDFYHGENASRARQDRDQFSGVNTNASITASFQITKRLIGVGALRSDFYGDAIANSPVVDRNTVTEATFGVVYSF